MLNDSQSSGKHQGSTHSCIIESAVQEWPEGGQGVGGTRGASLWPIFL